MTTTENPCAREVSGQVVRHQAQSVLQQLIDAGCSIAEAEKYVLLGLADAKRDGINFARLQYSARKCDVCDRWKENVHRVGLPNAAGCETDVCHDCSEKAKADTRAHRVPLILLAR